MSSFYKTTRWIKKRAVVLKHDGYLCKECRRYGKTTGATTVHHVYTLESHPSLRLVTDNLISLCDKCHEQMHDRMGDEVTDKGKAWQKRIERKLFQ